MNITPLLPLPCSGACWSFAATSSLNDRMKIVSKGAWPEVDLAPQVILNCDTVDNGCHGGDPITAYQFIHESGGIPDETCQVRRMLKISLT